MTVKNYICLILSLAVLPVLCAFTSGLDDCKEEVKHIYTQLVNYKPNPKKVFYVRYQVRSVSLDSLTGGVSESLIEMWSKGELLQIKSREVEIYQDSKDVFTVLPYNKVIVRSDPVLNKDNKNERLLLFRDTLFNLSTVVYCKAEGPIKKVVLEVNPQGRQLFGISQLTIYINTIKNRIQKVKMNYAQDRKTIMAALQNVVYVEYTVEVLDYDHTQKTLSKSVSNKFISNGRLKAYYAGYELVDSRYQANKEMVDSYVK